MHINNFKVGGYVKRKKPLECGCIKFVIAFIDYSAKVIFVTSTTPNNRCLMQHIRMFSIREEHFNFYEIVNTITIVI